MASCIRGPGGGGKPKVKVCIVDDDGSDRLMTSRILEKSGEFQCASTYATADEALSEIPRLFPDAVLMDIRMPRMSGTECARRLKGLLPGLVVIFVTGLLDTATMTEALQAGGDDYLLKPLVIAQCLATIRFAIARRRLNGACAQTRSTRQLPPLNSRETAVMEKLAAGLLYKEIADKLQITEAVVHKLQHSIFCKWRVGNRSEAIGVFFRKEILG